MLKLYMEICQDSLLFMLKLYMEICLFHALTITAFSHMDHTLLHYEAN